VQLADAPLPRVILGVPPPAALGIELARDVKVIETSEISLWIVQLCH